MSLIALPVPVITRKWVQPNFEFAFPEVIGLANPAAQQRINGRIRKLLFDMVRETGYPENPQTEVLGSYEIKTNERNVLSLVLDVYWFAGGAHGMTVIRALTFDTETGRIYRLRDLFKEGSDYVRVLSDQVAEQIQQRDVPLLEEPFEGIRPDQDYYIADKALVLFFQLYALTPYVYGFPFFPISVYAVQDIIRPESPLDRMVVNK